MRGQVKVYQKKLVEKRRKRAIWVGLSALLAIGVIFSGLSLLSHLESFSIDVVSVVGEERAREAEIESVVRSNLAGNYLAFFSKRNAFLYPDDDMKGDLLAMPLLESVELKNIGLRQIEISIKERKESALWCSGEIRQTGGCFSVDENGFVFDRSATSSTFIYRGLLTENPIGQSILTPEEFKKTQFFARELERLGLRPIEAMLDQSNYMTVLLGAGGKLYVNTRDDLSSVLANLDSIISDRIAVPSLERFLQNLDYIKLDSGNKVVYKLK